MREKPAGICRGDKDTVYSTDEKQGSVLDISYEGKEEKGDEEEGKGGIP